ncbi:MAG: hypothetical protein GY856_50930, partial [bacterium]|nr:hypothetical protein [bacterium]
MKTKAITILLILAVILAGAAAAQTEQWIHVRVQENADKPDGETVTINLPLSLITAAAALIPVEEVSDEAEIALDDLNMNWGDLRTFWDAVKDAPEATFVTVQTRDENVEVKKKGDYLLVKTVESGKHGA